MFVCVAKTSVEWPALLQNAQRACGRSITESLDRSSLPASGIAAFAIAVSEFSAPGGNAWAQIKEDVAAKRHAMFSFLVNLPREEFAMLASFGLTVTLADVGDFALVSGRLSDWVQALVDASQVKRLRLFACSIHAWFERENLGPAWSAWDKDHIKEERLFRFAK